MKLYRIRKKSTGKFYSHSSTRQIPYYCLNGTYFRTKKGLMHNLNNLCSLWDRANKSRTFNKYGNIVVNPKLKNLYYIVVSDMTLNGEEVLEAKDLELSD